MEEEDPKVIRAEINSILAKVEDPVSLCERSNKTTIRSRWAKIRDRKETIQFLERGKYVAVVADGKVHLYPGKK